MIALAYSAPTPAPQENAATSIAPVRIMAFGASIVENGCWRAYLWKKLQDTGLTNIDAVGSRPGPTNCGFAFDGDSEGHSGALATEFADKNQLPAWLNAAKPDIIIMHLGTNDALKGKPVKQILDAYSKLVDQMRASKPNMKIIISKLIPIDGSRFGGGDLIEALNKGMDAWAAKKTTRDSPIVIIDNFTGFDPKADTTDGEHPNDSGNHKIAAKFFPPLVDAINSVSAHVWLERFKNLAVDFTV